MITPTEAKAAEDFCAALESGESASQPAPSNIIGLIKEMGADLARMFPALSPSLDVSEDGRLTLHIHARLPYRESTELARMLGMGKREKNTFSPDAPWFTLDGRVDDVRVLIYGKGLPDTCRVEKTIEKIPKQQTVDTGDFIEVVRNKIVCGEAEAKETA